MQSKNDDIGNSNLYRNGTIQITGDDSIQIEQFTLNQVLQVITERVAYSVQELGDFC